jgi:hypothetical protein
MRLMGFSKCRKSSFTSDNEAVAVIEELELVEGQTYTKTLLPQAQAHFFDINFMD